MHASRLLFLLILSYLCVPCLPFPLKATTSLSKPRQFSACPPIQTICRAFPQTFLTVTLKYFGTVYYDVFWSVSFSYWFHLLTVSSCLTVLVFYPVNALPYLSVSCLQTLNIVSLACTMLTLHTHHAQTVYSNAHMNTNNLLHYVMNCE